MATYVCSDIHGRYDRYMKLIDEIKLSRSDDLYILGDVIDRNPYGTEILSDILKRQNVHLLIGNHELFLLDSIIENNIDSISLNKDWYESWTLRNNGGDITFKSFMSLQFELRKSILEMLESCPVIKVIEVNGKKFHLSHSSTLKGFLSDELLYKDTNHEQLMTIVWKSVFRLDSCRDSVDKYDKDITYIVGHVPVQRISGDEILSFNNIINIDCGCAYQQLPGSSLGCLRLDDMKEFYVRD